MLKFVTKEGKTKFVLLDEDEQPIGLTDEELEEYELAKSSKKIYRRKGGCWPTIKEIIDHNINNKNIKE